jgi:4a-hydroxytetrahydrobiopterin dehydratase
MATTPLSAEALTAALTKLNGWSLADDKIEKTYQFKGYLDGIAFASAVGVVAEAHDHHPDLSIGWRKVTVSFTTHDAGHKVSQKDVDAAAAIDALGYPRAG